jgi:ABC-2 type transport system permease protein
VRAIRTLRSTWRGLETRRRRGVSAEPARQSSTLLTSGDWKRNHGPNCGTGKGRKPPANSHSSGPNVTAPVVDSTAVIDQDRSFASHQLIAHFDGSPVFTLEATLTDPGKLAALINSRRVRLALEVQEGFARQLAMGQTTSVQIVADGRNANTAEVATSYAAAIINGFNAQWRRDHGLPASQPLVVIRSWFNPNLQTRWSMIPGLIGTISLIQTMMLAAMSVAREREQGTFDQLLVTPIRPAEIMIGKAIPAMLIGIFQATTILLVAQLWFRIPFAGSFVILYMGLILFVLSAVGLGIFPSSIAMSMQQAMLYGMVVIMPATLLSGLSTPISNMPEILQFVTYASPLRYAIQIAQRVYLEGIGVSQLLPYLWPMVVIAVVTLGMATWMFRRRVG